MSEKDACTGDSDRFLFDESEREILTSAIEEFGIDPQVDMAIEECAEVIQAIQHHKRGRESGDRVVEEIADAIIILNQLALMFDRHKVGSHIAEKLDQLNHRVETGEWNARLNTDTDQS